MFANIKKIQSIFIIVVAMIAVLALGSFSTGCNVYKFRDISIPDSIKTVKVNFIENRASYVNPQLSPRLTDELRRKIVSQTRLSQTNNDNADWIIDGKITGYTPSTSGIGANQQIATNRLTVTVHISLNDQKSNKTNEYDVSRNFEFSATQSLNQAEATLLDKILKDITDDIFNRVFSNW